MYDLLVIGAGPAGVSAALTACHRHRSVLVVSNAAESNPLYRTPMVRNYPGVTGSGPALLAAMHGQLAELDIPVVWQRAVQAMALGDRFACSAGPEVYEGRALLLTVGRAPKASVTGETEFLGRGVSYCATCDGLLYRGKSVAVLGFGGEAAADANLLFDMGCRVRFFTKRERPADLRPEIECGRAVQYVLHGGDRVTGVEADGFLYPADGVFILRDGMAADSLLPGLRVEAGRIVTDRNMAASIPGVFAAGDCTGPPYQIAKAAGEGNVAALAADRWLQNGKENQESWQCNT